MGVAAVQSHQTQQDQPQQGVVVVVANQTSQDVVAVQAAGCHQQATAAGMTAQFPTPEQSAEVHEKWDQQH